MVSTAAVVGIALVALGLVLTPGPNMIYLVSRSISQGRSAGLVSLLGVAAGFGVYLAAAAAGPTARAASRAAGPWSRRARTSSTTASTRNAARSAGPSAPAGRRTPGA